MLYNFELQMAGVILLTAMAIGGISMWLKRRKEQNNLTTLDSDDSQNL